MKELRPSLLLLHTDQLELNKHWNFSNVVSPFYRLYLAEAGQGLLVAPKSSIVIEQGFLYLVPSYTLCSYSCDDYLHQHYIHFTEELHAGRSLFFSNRKIFKVPAHTNDILLFKRVLELNPGRNLRRSNDPRIYQQSPALLDSKELNYRLPFHVQLETEGILIQLLSRFLASPQYHVSRTGAMPLRLHETLEYIQDNLGQPLTVATLAKQSHLHPDYFSRIFREEIGEGPLEYIRHKRIERAQVLIITTESSFSEIAFDTGFESLSYFSRVFKKYTGMSPGSYRLTHQRV